MKKANKETTACVITASSIVALEDMTVETENVDSVFLVITLYGLIILQLHCLNVIFSCQADPLQTRY